MDFNCKVFFLFDYGWLWSLLFNKMVLFKISRNWPSVRVFWEIINKLIIFVKFLTPILHVMCPYLVENSDKISKNSHYGPIYKNFEEKNNLKKSLKSLDSGSRDFRHTRTSRLQLGRLAWFGRKGTYSNANPPLCSGPTCPIYILHSYILIHTHIQATHGESLKLSKSVNF
jgi:hypothetical protein